MGRPGCRPAGASSASELANCSRPFCRALLSSLASSGGLAPISPRPASQSREGQRRARGGPLRVALPPDPASPWDWGCLGRLGVLAPLQPEVHSRPFRLQNSHSTGHGESRTLGSRSKRRGFQTAGTGGAGRPAGPRTNPASWPIASTTWRGEKAKSEARPLQEQTNSLA